VSAENDLGGEPTELAGERILAINGMPAALLMARRAKSRRQCRLDR
jgi:hypothetical protein